jgi:diguanylate cyclase (GGDEF)-like protein
MISQLSSYLKRFASPGFVSDQVAIGASYLLILAIFPIDVVTGSRVTLNVIYVLPLTVIGLHCSRLAPVVGALSLSIVVQLLTLLSFSDDPMATRIGLFVVITVSDAVVVLIARFARHNILEAEQLSTTDPLTRLSNRRALEFAIDAESTRQRRYGGIYSLVLIDLDGFKSVNDTQGHAAGDNALILLAEILRSNTRKSDMIFRIGGDEFVVLMPNTGVADAASLCDSFCTTIARQMLQASFPITASIGFTTVEQAPEPSVDVLTIADRAMYEAKSTGKSRVVRGQISPRQSA